MNKKIPTKETPEKVVPKQLATKAESTTIQKPQPEKDVPKSEEVKVESAPKPEKAQSEAVEPKLSDIKLILDALTATVLDHTRQIAEVQEALARKRKPVSNGKIQIIDKKTGQIFPSKNSTYQTLLKSGELKALVNKGIFGDNPEKNTFGWYALVRAWPDRFEEVKVEQTKENA